ncbi:MAG: HCOMODA/2-hydroxy-3-carboxy-muconic semialdehyde decarboxylase [Ramlibacter sp.]|jgi:ribulose-5-phosphate 4-epimerase/fuculose-1-phosphate aldolase|uniref:class II aldolase/adducin family protein n=1 Tax=Ramlibacter sp. TaxID=1917967 RepID=UPI002636BA77|nr:class II aldolase/adducin family protein [Ramlibacter sp.]MDB5750038.1 HCOMODA/2-hydroxy-3-carboxy-muconic semialdehyde decarboxylase [Ramlibacter sp.]
MSLLQQLVDANHILFHQGVLDAFGHVSVRSETRPDRFLLARNMAPALVAPDDIIEFELDGAPVDAGDRRVYLERFIHGSIYRARPDVMAVVHSHSPSVVPFSVSRRNTLRPVCHMSGFLGSGAGLFEIRDVAGPATDLLITDDRLGRALADSLGERNAVLMRGHGSTVVAPSLKLAVYRAVYAEINAKLQTQAIALGDPVYLTEEEAGAAERSVEGQVERPWALWRSAARRAAGLAP